MDFLPQRLLLDQDSINTLNTMFKMAEIESKIYHSEVVLGGCTHQSYCLFLENGQRYFIKLQHIEQKNLFQCETISLDELRISSFRIPKVLLYYDSKNRTIFIHTSKRCFIDRPKYHFPSFILMEYIESSCMNVDTYIRESIFTRFAIQLAQLHQVEHNNYGFKSENYLGKNLQKNQWQSSWKIFFVQQRLSYQIELLKTQGLWDNQLQKQWNYSLYHIKEQLDVVVEKPSLVHGDLWKHNFLIDINQEICLFDPAVYYGHREVDLAMTKLFGGFSKGFYQAYQQSYPLNNGYEQRFLIYHLYHFLSYMNSFGRYYRTIVYNLLTKISNV